MSPRWLVICGSWLASLLAGLVWASASWACADGTSLFSCEIGSKRLSLCLDGRTLNYAYGPENAPELELERDVLDVDYVPWPGVGRTLFETVQIENSGYTYEVWHSIDRLDLDAVLTGGVSVTQGGNAIAELECRNGTADGDLYPLFEAIESAGYCFNTADRTWAARKN